MTDDNPDFNKAEKGSQRFFSKDFRNSPVYIQAKDL